MRKSIFVLALILLMAFAGVAVAGPGPREGDPTCGNPGGPASGQECAGDNGNEGCDGINVAENTPAGEAAEDALDLVRDILEQGEGDQDPEHCEGGESNRGP